MMHAGPIRPGDAPASARLVAAAARCWRSARDEMVRPQQRLHALLSPHGGDMLGPVFDSLLTLYEGALGRRLVVGMAADLSQDESLLIALLDGSRQRRACLHCPDGRGSAFDCAICSMRLMLGSGHMLPINGA